MESFLILIYLLLFAMSVMFMLNGKYKHSTLILLIFATGGLSILPDKAGLLKATHLTFLYVILFCIKNYRRIKQYKNINREIKWLIRLSLFFLLNILVSILYFGFPPGESITTGLRYLLLLSLLAYIPLTRKDYTHIFKIVYYITFFASILYIMQAVIGQQILPSSSGFDGQDKNAGTGGLYHFLNMPVFTIVFIPISIFCKDLIPKKLYQVSSIVFFSALFVTLFRTHIVSMVLCIFVVMFLKRDLRRNLTSFMTIIVVSLLFGSIFFERATKQNDSAGDISAVLAGRISDADYQAKDGMTLLYRFAWIAERLDYMKERPVELIFGLGMISDKKLQNKYYHFNFGLVDPNTGYKNQVGTPDIAWGNLLTRYGFLGSFFVMGLYFAYMRKLWRYRKVDDLCLVLFAYLLSNLLASFSGATISDPIFWQPLFFLFAFANKRMKLYNQTVCIK